MTAVRRLRVLVLLAGVFAAIDVQALPQGDEAVARLLHALRPVPTLGRQRNIGAVLREFKEQGLIPFRPLIRVDYTDYYRIRSKLRIFGHDLVLVEEEYMTKYAGCCVSEGGGFVVRLQGSTSELAEFAAANRCTLHEYESLEKYQMESNLSFVAPSGRYAELSCRVRDEDK
jgi:hypothetical protein